MRVRDHVALSTVAAAVLYPRLRRRVLGFWAASIFIDVDHYLWYAVRSGGLDAVAAVRHFNSADAPESPETRRLHHPALLLGLAAVSAIAPALRLPVLGMAFHVGLDSYHRARTERSRAAARQRDGNRCGVCGSTEDVVVHVWRQPRLLPSYRTENFAVLCASCHEAAHFDRRESIAGMGTDWESYLVRTGLERRLAVTSRR